MRKRRAAALVATGAAAVVIGDVTPAFATSHQVQTLANSSHTLIARGDEVEVGSGLEHWSNFRTQEIPTWLDTVCAYQSFMAEKNPSGTVIFTEYSSYHASCSVELAYFDWPGWDANYLENTHFLAKWKSNTTINGAWQSIGELSD